MRQYFYGLTCEKVTGKPSLTKFIALVFAVLMVIGVLISFGIMIYTMTIDHYIIGELLTFIALMTGMKNMVLSSSRQKVQDKQEEH